MNNSESQEAKALKTNDIPPDGQLPVSFAKAKRNSAALSGGAGLSTSDVQAGQSSGLVGAGGVSVFVRESIEKQLKQLRYNCCLQRLHLRNAHGPRWSGQPRRNPDKPDSWDLHWENLQAQAQITRAKDVKEADEELTGFIAEHRPIMGSDWIGNDHGRLCWADYLGGYPIDHHYCQREEGHEGNHGDEWPEHRWACEHPRGSWPQGVTCDREWRDKIEAGVGGAEQAAQTAAVTKSKAPADNEKGQR
jgi:hypothetical protein